MNRASRATCAPKSAARTGLALVLLLVACDQPHDGAGSKCGPAVVEDEAVAFAPCIPNPGVWTELRARPPGQAVARTEVVKFLIDLHEDRRVYFVNTQRWPVHYDFAATHLSRPTDPVLRHALFNFTEYRDPTRRFVCGSLVHYLDADVWAMELLTGDNLAGRRVQRAFEQLQRAVYFGDALRYRPISALHRSRLDEDTVELPRLSTEDVFGAIQYQPLTHGTATGELVIVRRGETASARPDAIYVFEELPDEVPRAAAIISAQLQAPLGHVALLCANRGTPNMALRDALDDRSFAALAGQRVQLVVGPQEYTLEAATGEAIPRAEPTTITPPLADDDGALRALADLRLDDASTVGAKAAQLGEAASLGETIVTPGGFVVPFSRYATHLRSAHAMRLVNLAERRDAIERAPVERRLLAAVHARIQAFEGAERVILRSSTNAEDLPGFTGAGLYESRVIDASADANTLADALRAVWASVWREAAHDERDAFGIDHDAVRMAVLVQPFVRDARANGVAITANPFHSRQPGYLINAQPMSASVTGAEGGEIPEQHLLYTFIDGDDARLLSLSSEQDGPVLTPDDLSHLRPVLETLHRHFVPRWGARANAVDVEFLIAGDDREVVVLQARPFLTRPPI